MCPKWVQERERRECVCVRERGGGRQNDRETEGRRDSYRKENRVSGEKTKGR